MHHSDVFPPISIPGDSYSRDCHSVNVFLPEEVAEEFDRFVKTSQISSRTVEIHSALYLYRSSEMTREQLRQEFQDKIQEGIDSGPGIEVDDTFWKNLDHEGGFFMRREPSCVKQGNRGTCCYLKIFTSL